MKLFMILLMLKWEGEGINQSSQYCFTDLEEKTCEAKKGGRDRCFLRSHKETIHISIQAIVYCLKYVGTL